jgi:hypothetical protein
MPYTAPTLAQAQAALASRLNDTSNVHWVADELTAYLREALRTWNAWTSHWRDRGTLTLTPAQAFYDLTVDLSGSLRAQTITNGELIADLQYALMEPAAPFGTWTGTDQFTLAQLSTAIQRRVDQFLRETGCQQTRAELPFAATASGRMSLDEAVLIVRRAAWLPGATAPAADQWRRPLLRDDDWAASAFLPSWRTPSDRVRAYSLSDTPPLDLQLIPPPAADGTLDLVSINKSATIDPVVSAVIAIPDDWAWVIKWGALADLLSGDGLALDPARAAYCEQRWQQGVDACVRTPIVLNAYNSTATPILTASLNEADKFSPTWQLVPGVPRRLLLAGQNLVASWPPPGNSQGNLTLDVVRNAPVPTVAGDVLQISADVYDSILDLAQHTALFKQGPGELELASGLLERAMRAAGVELSKQQAEEPERAALTRQNAQDGDAVPREQTAVPT